jgi:glycosyltransferase involved in cell wall biosynthesis
LIRFSIVTPSYNQGRFIQRTVESVLSQGYPLVEYVICDGGSSDDTATILHSYMDHVRVVIEPDNGQADAVNKGICLSSGDVIGWVNSDDTYRPGALMTVAGFFAHHPRIDVVYGDADLVDTDERVIGRYYTEPWDRERLLHRPFICQPAVFFRRDVIQRFGLLNQDLHYTLDYEYWLRLAYSGASFAYLPYTLANARLHPDSKTETHGLRQFMELDQVLKRYAARVPDGWILTETQAILRQQHRRFRHPFHYASAVTRISWERSMQLNGSISPTLLLRSVRTLAAGLIKSARGLPVVLPTE